MLTVKGQCHCGNLSSVLEFPADTHHFTVFGCHCSFCRLHGASWIGDPATRLTLSAEDPGLAGWYCHGALSNHYLLCQHCGGVMAACFPLDGIWHGIVNVLTTLLPPLPQDFLPYKGGLDDQQRLVLRRQRFVPDIGFMGGLAPPVVEVMAIGPVATGIHSV